MTQGRLSHAQIQPDYTERHTMVRGAKPCALKAQRQQYAAPDPARRGRGQKGPVMQRDAEKGYGDEKRQKEPFLWDETKTPPLG